MLKTYFSVRVSFADIYPREKKKGELRKEVLEPRSLREKCYHIAPKQEHFEAHYEA